MKLKAKAYLIFFLSWLVPGLGHLLLKKYIKTAVFFTSIILMFVVGVFLNGRFFDSELSNPLALLAYFGNIGNGLLFFITKHFDLLRVNFSSPTYEYGTAYLATSGFLNYLIALNAFDIARGKKK